MHPAGIYEGRWITVREAAKRLGLKESSIYAMMSTGRLFHAKNLKHRQLISEQHVEREEFQRKLRREGWKASPAPDPAERTAEAMSPASFPAIEIFMVSLVEESLANTR